MRTHLPPLEARTVALLSPRVALLLAWAVGLGTGIWAAAVW